MRASIQIIAPPTNKSHASFIISFDTGTYLFNVGEGTQRIVNQNKIRLGKLKSIFNSRMDWNVLGGLPGMILTCSDASIEKLEFVGPKKMVHFLAANRHFLHRPNLSVAIEPISELEQECFRDENLVVKSISLLPSENSIYTVQRKEDGVYAKKRKLLEGMFALKESCCALPKNQQIDTKVNPTIAMVYICQGPFVRGKMDGKKAKELGVKGNDRKKLIEGESVMSTFGKLVSPSDCIGPSRQGSVIVVIDCPSLAYLNSLLTNNTIQKCISDPKNPPKTMIHQVSFDVLCDKRYVDFLLSISVDTQHIILSEGLHEQEIIYESSEQLLRLLNQIDSNLFPLNPVAEHQHRLPVELQHLRFHIGSTRTLLDFEPNLKLELLPEYQSSSIPTDLAVIQEHVLELKKEFDVPVPEYPYIIPLGTASCMPSKHRNVSSNYIRMEQGSVLLDVGEGSISQLRRHFGDNLEYELNQLQMIFVSHLHADHHLGAFGVIKAWDMATRSQPEKRLYVIAPSIYLEWMTEYAEIEKYGLDRIVFIECSVLTAHDFAVSDLKKSLQLKSIKTVPVLHCHDSYAIVIEDESFFKFSYSGDCRPSEEFILAGQNSDLLIHEATFEDELLQEAIAKNHTTIGEAIEVGERFCELI